MRIEERKFYEDGEFAECEVCSAKPGMHDLCPSCLHNRSSMSNFKIEIKRLKGLMNALYYILEIGRK